MIKVFAYIRVSTTNQGKNGVSLDEQRDAIINYAGKHNLHIVRWFEEQTTAARSGRKEFGIMIKGLENGEAAGLIIHKIDRSARNLKDWAAIGELSDNGISIHFTNESVDLSQRNDRLSADIQAVVAANFVRNLKEEAWKGVMGRLKQGIYPFSAPLGYVNNGPAKLKTIHQLHGPIVKHLFQLYATEEYSLSDLVITGRSMGLTSRTGGKIYRNTISTIFHNPFYAGILRVKSTGETFPGKHDALVSLDTFERVTKIMSGKTFRGSRKHDFLYSRTFMCSDCKRYLIGELQKGHVYYRCHGCKGTCIREYALDDVIKQSLSDIEPCFKRETEISSTITHMTSYASKVDASVKRSQYLTRDSAKSKLDILTQNLIDGTVDRSAYLQRKNSYINDIQQAEAALTQNSDNSNNGASVPQRALELSKSLIDTYNIANNTQKRRLLKIVCSNLFVNKKEPLVKLCTPFLAIGNCGELQKCTDCRTSSRSGDKLPERHTNAVSGLSCDLDFIVEQMIESRSSKDHPFHLANEDLLSEDIVQLISEASTS